MDKASSSLLILIFVALTSAQLTVRNNCSQNITVYSYTGAPLRPNPYKGGVVFPPQFQDVIEVGEYGIELQLWSDAKDRNDQTVALVSLAHLDEKEDYACYGSRRLNDPIHDIEIQPSDPSCDSWTCSSGEAGHQYLDYWSSLNFTVTFCPSTNATMSGDSHNALLFSHLSL